MATLKWPSDLHIPSKHFRLFVAADVTRADVTAVAEFAHAALTKGMVYFCAWGPDCGRFHDIVDEVIVADDISLRLFAGPDEQDTIMTTWHENETLDDALDFFANWSLPTTGFQAASDYWLAFSLGDPSWAATIKWHLEEKLK